MGTEKGIEIAKALSDRKIELLKAWGFLIDIERSNRKSVILAIKHGDLDKALELVDKDRKVKRLKSWVRGMLP